MKQTKIKQSEESFEPQPISQRDDNPAGQVDNPIGQGNYPQWQAKKYGGKPKSKKLCNVGIVIAIIALGVLLIIALDKHLRQYSLIKQELKQIKATIQKQTMQVKQNEIMEKAKKKPQSVKKDIASAKIELPKEENSSQLQVDQKDAFVIPKKLWIYKPSDNSYYGRLVFDNNKHFGKESGFEVNIIDRQNFRPFASKEAADDIDRLIKGKSDFFARTYIMLHILNQNGGVLSHSECTITETFEWIRRIAKNPYVNRGIREGVRPQVVGFYAYDYTNDKAKENIKPYPGMSQVDKYMAIFPTLEEYFLAANKDTPYITELLRRIKSLFEYPSQFSSKQSQYQLRNINTGDLSSNFLRIASQTILQDKQKQLDSANKQPYRQFAIDYYGLNLINNYYGPFKMNYFWGGLRREQFIMMSRFTMEEYNTNFGPSFYLSCLTPFSTMNGFLEDVKGGRMQPIIEDSIIQKFYYPKSNQPFITKTKEKFFINETSESWDSLPKKIWLFYDIGLSNAPIISQVCAQSIKRMAKPAGFEVIEVNKANAHQYIPEQTIKKITFTMANAKVQTFQQSQSDFYRLAFLKEHGGLYLDVTYVLMENLEWLINIGRYPSQYIFNRFGRNPKVVMIWYGMSASPFDWKVDEKYNTKSLLKVGYENNFMACEKGSELISEWFETFTRLYIKPYSDINQIFNTECPISDHKWTNHGDHYLIAMDSIKCVIARRQKKLEEEGNKQFASAADYYKLWSLNGNMGQQKLRLNTNYDNLHSTDIRFAYRYSQEYVEGILGKFRQLTKFFGRHKLDMTNFINNHQNGNFLDEAHPQSIFMKHIWQPNFSLENGKLKIRS